MTTAAASRLTTVTGWDSNGTTYSYDDAGRMDLVELPNYYDDVYRQWVAEWRSSERDGHCE